MVFYFSGTGGSQLAAEKIAEVLSDDIISINKAMKNRKKNTYKSTLPLIFVAPTYSWRIPKDVEKWIRKNNFAGNRNAYFVLTCGGNVGNAMKYAKQLCDFKGFSYCGLAPVVMPENYIALFRVPKEAECNKTIEKAIPVFQSLAEKIKIGQTFDTQSINLMDRILSGPVNPLFYKMFVHDSGFAVNSSCVSCNKCAERCPLNNIDIIDGNPVWKGNCTHCMACIAGCPAKAIEYKSNSKGQHRYFIMKD